MYSPNHIKHKITNLQLVMQLKPEKKRLPWEDDYNPKNRIFKFNIYQYTSRWLQGFGDSVIQVRFPTIEGSSFIWKIW